MSTAGEQWLLLRAMTMNGGSIPSGGTRVARMREPARDRNPSYATGNFSLDVHSTDRCRFNETFGARATKAGTVLLPTC